MEQIIKRLKFQDVIDTTFIYFFNRKRNQHSILTVTLSLGINIFILILFLLGLNDLINHNNPDVNFAKMKNGISPNLAYNTKELLFSIGIRDKNHTFINDPTIASIKAFYHIKINQDKFIALQNEMTFINCSTTHNIYQNLDIENYYISNSIEQYLCFNYSTPVIVGGRYGTTFYGNLVFYIIKCQNGTKEGTICKSNEEINEKIQDGWVQTNYISSYVDYNNYNNPIGYMIDGPYAKLDVNINKITYIYFSQIKTETNSGWIFPSKSLVYSTEVDYTQSDINIVKNDGIIATIYVCPSDDLKYYLRKYTKIQNIAASVGGMFNGLYLIATYIIKYFCTYKYDIEFANSLFFFSFENFNKNMKKPKIYGKNLFKIESKNNGSENSISKLGMLNQLSDLKLSINKNIKKNNFYQFKLNVRDLFRLALDKITKKGKFLKKEYRIIKHEIINYSDFINIGKNIIEVEKIKKVLDGQFDKSCLFNQNKKTIVLNEKYLKYSTYFRISKFLGKTQYEI